MIKKLTSICLAIIMIFTQSSLVVYANSEPTYDEIKDLMSHSFMYAETIEEINRSEYNGLYDFFYEIGQIEFSEEQISEAEKIIENYLSNNIGTMRNSSENIPSEIQEAKGTSIAYTLDRARYSANRYNKRIEDESIYMFISHYIDRADYYWGDNKINLLLDGHRRSGASGSYADMITNDDRIVYDSYIRAINMGEFAKTVGDISLAMFGIYGLGNDYIDIATVFSTNTNLMKFLQANEIYGTSKNIFDIAHDNPEFMDSLQGVINDGSTLEEISDYFFDPDHEIGLANVVPESSVVDTASGFISLICAAMIGGVSGVAGSIAGTLLSFNLELYNNLFLTAAWAAMHYSYSGRYALRFYQDMFG